jgi:PmbA protein
MKAAVHDPDLEILGDAASRLLSRARALGADGADAACSLSQALSVSVRLGKLEGVEREEARSAGLRVLIGKRQAGASTTDLSPAALDALAERVVDMAKAAAEDPWCAIPDSHAERYTGDLGLHDPTVPDIARLEARALEAEAAALAVEGVTNSSGSGADWGTSGVVYGASNGFMGTYRGTSWGMGLSALAEKDGHKERDYDGENARTEARLRGAGVIGRTAGERAVARLDARKLSSRTVPVIFENRVAGQLLRFLVGGINGAAVARGVSFLREKLGQKVFADGITILDDPFLPGGWGSHPFDGEGQAVTARTIVEDGVLTTWLMNGAAARQLGLQATGHATLHPGGPPGIGPSNLTLQPGTRDLAGLMSDSGTGLLVRETSSPSFNANTGDYSVGVSGHWFENGQIVHAVHEMTVAGSMLDIFARLVPGNDLLGRSSIDCPSVLVDAMAVAGT